MNSSNEDSMPNDVKLMNPKTSTNTLSLYRHHINEIKNFLESPIPNEKLVVCCFDLEICISRIRDSIAMELPVLEISIFGNPEDFMKISGSIFIAKVNMIAKEDMEIIKSIHKKMLVVTHEILVTFPDIPIIQVNLSWMDLTESYQKQLANYLMSSDVDDSALLKLLGTSMCNNPEIYSDFGNEALGQLMENNVTMDVLAFLIHCYLQYHNNRYSDSIRISVNDVIFVLASFSSDHCLKLFASKIRPSSCDSATLIDVGYLISEGILRPHETLEEKNVLRFRLFDQYIYAQIISRAQPRHVYDNVANLVRKHLLEGISLTVSCSAFTGNFAMAFLNLLKVDKKILQSIIVNAKCNRNLFEAFISAGYFSLPNQILQCNPHVFFYEDPPRCALPFGNLSTADSFMRLYTKTAIRVARNSLADMYDSEAKHSNYDTPLHVAIFRNDYNLFEFLLRKYNYKEIIRRNELTGLIHFCAAYTIDLNNKVIAIRLKIMKVIVMLNPLSVKVNGGQRSTLLAPNIHVKIIGYLLQAGVVPFFGSCYEPTIAHRAAKYMSSEMYLELAKLLVELGHISVFKTTGEHDEIPLFTACRNIDFSLVSFKELLPLSENGVDCKGYGSDSLLHVMAVRGNLEVLKYLLEENVNVNGQNDFGETPLHLVVNKRYSNCENCQEVVAVLLANNANANAKKCEGETPLDIATLWKRNISVHENTITLLEKA